MRWWYKKKNEVRRKGDNRQIRSIREEEKRFQEKKKLFLSIHTSLSASIHPSCRPVLPLSSHTNRISLSIRPVYRFFCKQATRFTSEFRADKRDSTSFLFKSLHLLLGDSLPCNHLFQQVGRDLQSWYQHNSFASSQKAHYTSLMEEKSWNWEPPAATGHIYLSNRIWWDSELRNR